MNVYFNIRHAYFGMIYHTYIWFLFCVIEVILWIYFSIASFYSFLHLVIIVLWTSTYYWINIFLHDGNIKKANFFGDDEMNFGSILIEHVNELVISCWLIFMGVTCKQKHMAPKKKKKKRGRVI